MTYAIIGTGAIGGYYGAKLAHAGKEVHFLLHSDYEYVKTHGLTVYSTEGNFTLPYVNAYNDVAQMLQADVVIVALKTTQNHLLSTLLPPLLKPDTLVLLIQNGIGVEADVAQLVPGTKLAAGLAFICSAKTEPGVVRHMDYGSINIANYNADADRVEAVVADFVAAGVAAKTIGYQRGRWQKAMWNMPFNGLTVALNTQTDQLLANPYTCTLAREMMLEVVRAAQAHGVEELTERTVDKQMDMTRNMTPYSPSMRLDWDFHRPMEIKYIYLRAIEEARAVGVVMPRLEMLAAMLKFMEERRL